MLSCSPQPQSWAPLVGYIHSRKHYPLGAWTHTSEGYK